MVDEDRKAGLEAINNETVDLVGSPIPVQIFLFIYSLSYLKYFIPCPDCDRLSSIGALIK